QVESETTYNFDVAANGLGQLQREIVTGKYVPWEGQVDTAALSFSRHHNYDAMGRPQSATTLIDDMPYMAATEYDALGRPYRVQDASGRWSKTEFGPRGSAAAVCDSDSNDRYWACGAALLRTLETDAFGNAIREVRSPTAQMPVTRNFNARSGRLETICAGSSCGLVNEAYGWDDAGNLHTHQKEGRYLETFTYDALNRLQEGRLSIQNGVPVNTVLQSFAYDGLGNVCSKNGVAFTYGGADGCTGASAASAPSVMQAGSMPAGTTARGGQWPNFRRGMGGDDRAARPAPMKVAWSYRSEHQAPDIRMVRYESPRAARAEKEQYRRRMQRQAEQPRQTNAPPVAVAKPASTAMSTASMSTGSPHAVSQTGSGTEASFYYYDERGNQTIKDAPGTAADRTVRYSLDDRAIEIGVGTGQRTRFWYGSDGQRYKREDSSGRSTYYLGNVEIIRDGAGTTIKRTVAGVVQQTIVGEAVSSHYLFHDHLGSLVRITDAAGTVVKGMDYAAFGERRDYNTPSASGSGTPITTRGYTGHEMLDGLGVIHMNGRIFDPGLGRFLQVDPFIQEPGNAQSWNAYTYVFNNPYRYTDPTGMLGVTERQWVAAAVVIVATIFAPQFSGQYAAAYMAAYYGAVGFVSGAIATQSFRGGVMGAMTAFVTAGIGGAVGNDIAGWALRTFTGGVMGALQGGNFGHSFVSAGLTAAFMPQIGKIGSDVGRVVVTAIVGGTISELTGGKFANGAVTGAIMAAMTGHTRRAAYGANKEDRTATRKPLPKAEAAATMKRGVSIFRQMREDGVMNGMALYDDIDTVNKAYPGAFVFTYDGERIIYSNGAEVVASADIYDYTGIKVHRVDSLDDVMDTIFHETAHLDIKMNILWRQSTPGVGSLSQDPDLRLQQQVHSQIDSSVKQLMEVYREKYRP
ncbi:MAG: RHS repeat-associated core domain-containing protein, partial [Lysobacter sp.]